MRLQVTAERIAEIELSKYDTIDRKVSAVEDLANKKIAGLEKTMSSMYTHQQMTKFVAKSKAPLVSQLRLMQEVRFMRSLQAFVLHIYAPLCTNNVWHVSAENCAAVSTSACEWEQL